MPRRFEKGLFDCCNGFYSSFFTVVFRTKPFPIWEPWNLWIDVLELEKNCRSTDFWTLKLWEGRSGCSFFLFTAGNSLVVVTQFFFSFLSLLESTSSLNAFPNFGNSSFFLLLSPLFFRSELTKGNYPPSLSLSLSLAFSAICFEHMFRNFFFGSKVKWFQKRQWRVSSIPGSCINSPSR